MKTLQHVVFGLEELAGADQHHAAQRLPSTTAGGTLLNAWANARGVPVNRYTSPCRGKREGRSIAPSGRLKGKYSHSRTTIAEVKSVRQWAWKATEQRDRPREKVKQAQARHGGGDTVFRLRAYDWP